MNWEIIVRNSNEFRLKNKKNNKDTEGRMRGKIQVHIPQTFQSKQCRMWQDTIFEETITEHFPKLNKDLNSMIKSVFCVLSILNNGKPTPRHIM